MELYLDRNDKRGKIDYYGRVIKDGKDFHFTLTQVGSSLYMDFWPLEEMGHRLVEAINLVLGLPKEGPTRKVLPSRCGKGVEILAAGWILTTKSLKETEEAILKRIKELRSNG